MVWTAFRDAMRSSTQPAAGESFDEWRLGELHGIQRRITRAVERNNLVAKRLNRVRLMATLTPVLAVIGVGVLELVERCR